MNVSVQVFEKALLAAAALDTVGSVIGSGLIGRWLGGGQTVAFSEPNVISRRPPCDESVNGMRVKPGPTRSTSDVAVASGSSVVPGGAISRRSAASSRTGPA